MCWKKIEMLLKLKSEDFSELKLIPWSFLSFTKDAQMHWSNSLFVIR